MFFSTTVEVDSFSALSSSSRALRDTMSPSLITLSLRSSMAFLSALFRLASVSWRNLENLMSDS